MKELVLDCKELNGKDRTFALGKEFELSIKGPDRFGTGHGIFIRTFDDLNSLNNFLVSLSKMISVKEEFAICVGVTVDFKHVYPYSVDLETGDVFPEF
jgi:hypothetical protein